MIVNMPSGLKGEARKLRGQEVIDLAERAGSGSGNSLGSILRGCWTRTIDPGPYAHAKPNEAGLDWDQVLKGDLIAGLLVLRASSVPVPGGAPGTLPGARYEFQVQCERCRKRYGWVVNDIIGDLPRRELSKESADRLRAGTPFTANCVDEDGQHHDLTFDLMLPEQDALLRQILKQHGRKRVTPVESLAVQTRTIDGKPMNPMSRQAFMAQLSLGEINRLRDLYDEADCGVDVDILTTCTDALDCGHTQETSLPFGRTFWRPDPPPKTPPPKDDKDQKKAA